MAGRKRDDVETGQNEPGPSGCCMIMIMITTTTTTI
jgi:hypothetical protein